MPKTSSRSKPVRRAVNKLFDAADKITSVVGNMFLQVSMTGSTVSKLEINPSYSYFGSRMNYFADVFNSFRFRDIRVELVPQGYDLMAAYDSIPNGTSTSNAYSDVSQLSKTAFLPAAGLTSKYLGLGPKALLRNQNVKWWNSRTTTTDKQLYTQGMLQLVSGSTFTAFVRLSWVCDFCHPDPPADYVSSKLIPGVSSGFPVPLKPRAITSLQDADSKDEDSWETLPSVGPDLDDCVPRLLAELSERLGAVVTVRSRDASKS